MPNRENFRKVAQVLTNFMNQIHDVGSYPLEVTQEVNKLRQLEREVNELARASGMSDSAFQSLLGKYTGEIPKAGEDLVSKAVGTEVQVLQMLKEIFLALGNTVDFSDPKNFNAIFGGIDKVNQHAGPELARSWVKDRLVPIIQKTRDMGISPSYMTNLLDDAVSSEIGADKSMRYVNPQTGVEVPFTDVVQVGDQFIDSKTQQPVATQTKIVDTGKFQDEIANLSNAGLANTSQDWQEFLGWKGNKFRDAMQFGNLARQTLTPILMRPDDQQRLQALIGRELTAAEQSKLRLLLGLEAGMTPSTLIGLEDAIKLLGLEAEIAPGAAEAAGVIPETGTFLTQTTTSPLNYLLSPGKSMGLTQKPAATTTASPKKKSKLIKIAQVPATYTYTQDPYNTTQDPYNPQPISGAAAFQSDVGQADVSTDAAAQARELEWNSILGQNLTGATMQAEKEANGMLREYLERFQQGLSSSYELLRQGVTNEEIVGQIQGLAIQAFNTYGQLTGRFITVDSDGNVVETSAPPNGNSNFVPLYNLALQQLEAKAQTVMRGDPELSSGTIAQLQGFKEDLLAQITKANNEQDVIFTHATSTKSVMMQQLQEAVTSDTLEQITGLAAQTGSSIGKGELAASQTTEARHLLDAADAAANAQHGTSAVMEARMRQKALEKMQKALSNLDDSAKSPVSSGEAISGLG